jgi:HSP20 family protein
MARFLSPYRGGRVWPTPLASFNREMSRMFEDLLHPGAETAAGFDPDIDVTETDNELRITAELPGVSEKDIDVSIEDDMLTIRGEKRVERKEEKENYRFSERSFGTFQRTLRLPVRANPDKIRASFEHGVLEVTVPKDKEIARGRRIEVKPGNGGRIAHT